MYKIPGKLRPFILLFAFWLVIEPCAITMLRAQEASDIPQPELLTDDIEGIEIIDEVLTPVEYLEYMLQLRGLTKDEAEAKAWGDWMTTITGAYMMMDEGSQDVFTFYSALTQVAKTADGLARTVQGIPNLVKKAMLVFAFIGKANVVAKNANLLRGLQNATKMVKRFGQFAQNNPTLKFLAFMSPPPCWNNPNVAGEGFKSYYRWVLKKTTGGTGLGNGGTKGLLGDFKAGPFDVDGTWDGGRYIDDWKGVSRTVGIGLTVLGMALDAYGIVTSEDRQGGRFSYSLAKNWVGLALGAASLIAMFCIPVVGQIVAAITIAWVIISAIGDLLGKYNKKWHEGYKSSHWFLYQEDPEYRIFYDNRDMLKEEEKSLSLKIAQRDFGEQLKDQAQPQSDDEKELQERNLRIFTTIEKQGVLMTYYNQTGFTMPDFDLNRLQELWRKKADFMSWKPNEAESEKAKNRGFWGTLGHVVNPMTYISWAGDKIQSQGYKREIENEDIRRVFFNPDYVLVKKYKNYLIGRNLSEGIYDAVGLRIEQAPFNYLPLIGIDTTAWSEELLEESFQGDAFIVGSKELIFFKEQIKIAHESAKEALKETKKTLKKIEEKDLKFCSELRQALQALVSAYKAGPDRVHPGLEDKLSAAPLKWRLDKKQWEPTPRNYISRYKADIEQMLLYEPLSLAQKTADTVLIAMTIKHNIDVAQLMQTLGNEKQETIDSFHSEFKNEAIRRFLEKGEFLDVNKSWWDKAMNWLSEIYPAYDELKKFTKLYNNEVEDFTKTADFANIKYNPGELVRDLNNEIAAYKDLYSDFEDIKDDAGLNMPLADDQQKFDGIFANFQIPEGVEEMTPLDVNAPVNEYLVSPILPPMNQ